MSFEGFASQVCNPVTEFFVTCCNKAALISVKGMAYVEGGVASATVFGGFRGI